MSAADSLSEPAQEWLDEMVTSWLEVYKKSATTLILLRIIRDHELASAALIGAEFVERTGWTLTERGLYRTLKRLADSGVVMSTDVPVERTGRPRKDYELTELGEHYLRRLESISI